MSDSVKDVEFDGSVKERGSHRRMRLCPYCGNELHPKILNRHVFCSSCHRRMPWMVVETDEKPLKPL